MMDVAARFKRETAEHVELIRDGSVPPGTSKALLEHAEEYDCTYEVNARQMLDDFEHKGFRFHDTWDWGFRDYDWWFVWACHAILWGVAKYDAGAPAIVEVELPVGGAS